MKQVIKNLKTGEITVDELPAPTMKSGGILVKNHFSLINAGAEKTSVGLRKVNMLQKTKSRPDDIRKILQEIKLNGFVKACKKVTANPESLKAPGYSSAGVVLAVDAGTSEFKPGDRVACAGGGYATHSDIIFVPKNLAVKVPDGVGLDEAAYSALGSIAMQGVRQVGPSLGENVVVIGLGLVGLLAVQILKANGCRVFGIDDDPGKVKLAREIGGDDACERSADVRTLVDAFSDGSGADAVIVAAATKSGDSLSLAGEIARDRSRVVLIGATGMNTPDLPFYGKELEFSLSRSYVPGRYEHGYDENGRDYPISLVRWSENRNMKEFVRLLKDKKVNVVRLTTHRFPLRNAGQAYKIISGKKKQKHIGILLEYDKETSEAPEVNKPDNREIFAPKTNAFGRLPLSVGFIGAGSFAQGNLIPAVRNIEGVALHTVCTASGASARTAQDQFGFKLSTTNSQELFLNENIGTVFIATRHNLHASFALEALKAGKNVFVEKPLALNDDELVSLSQFYRGSDEENMPALMVGFNRRFAPLTKELKRYFENSGEPMVVNCRVNAGYIPKNHWTQDPVEGGGRILGDVCHFVDLIQFITGSRVVKVYAESISADNVSIVNNDNLNITLKMANGSLGIITYLANADSSLPRERIEVTSGRKAAIIDNFRNAYFYRDGKVSKTGTGTMDKGIREELKTFIRSVNSDRVSPIAFDELINTTLATFRILTSLSVGEAVAL